MFISAINVNNVQAYDDHNYPYERDPCLVNGQCPQYDPEGFCRSHCTSYSSYMLNVFGVDFHNSYRGTTWSNGGNWNNAAANINGQNISVDNHPLPGDIAYWEYNWTGNPSIDYDNYGHVAWVEKVHFDSNGNATHIDITEYNYEDHCGFGQRITVPVNNPSGFIHILAYEEGLTHLYYLDCWEMDTLCTEQTKQEWLWILKRVWNNYRCTNCSGDYNSDTIAVLAEYIGGMGGGGEYDPEPTDPDFDSDLHISRFHIREVGDDDYEHNVERTLNKGDIIYVEGEMKVRNESSQEAEDVDSDYRIEDERDFDDQDTKIDEDNPFDIDPGEKVTKHMSSVKIEVSADGRRVTVSRDSMTKHFAIIDNFVKIYFFTDVEEPGGDQDISSETDDDEYAKVEITVLDPPTANFTASPTDGTGPLTVTFTDQSTSNTISWSWNFGDGGISNYQNPSHIYTNTGTYTVTLTVSNSDGLDSETKTDYIVVPSAVPGAPTNFRLTAP
ncbi:MAG: PKD domain-containing protein [Patescibacteria group bacterium]|nr:PKD domain-containing protein [Patescibacteria group bacterium]